MAKRKSTKKEIGIGDLPIMHVGGKSYYAFNVALRYLKQNNKEQFKGMTQKKFKEVYGEDSIFKLTGCGSWIEVNFFNQISNKMTKVVVKTLDQEVKSQLSATALAGMFFVKDEVSQQAHELILSQIPQQAQQELEKFELATLNDGEKLMKAIDNLIEVTKDFHSHGYTSARPYLYENGKGYLVGDGVLVEVDEWGYCFATFEADGDWENDKAGKLCRYVEEYQGEPAHMQEFVPCDIDFSGMTPRQAIIKCWNMGLFVDECDYMRVDYDCIEITSDYDELLHIMGSHERPKHLDKRMVDLTPILEQAGIVVNDNKVEEVEEYEPTVVEADYYDIVEEVELEPISDCEIQATINDREEVEKMVEEVVETLTQAENVVNDCEVEEEFNPYKKAEELGFDLSANHYSYIDREFRYCETVEEIDEEFNKLMRMCGRDMCDLEYDRYVRCADFWSLKILAKEYDLKHNN